MIQTLVTARLTLRPARPEDAAFLLRLMNEPSWLQSIGDRHVRTLADATRYLEDRFFASYRHLGFGSYIVELISSPVAMGICGLIKRDTLDEVDLGFAFLPEYWGKGYALEAARAVLEHGRNALHLRQIVAITSSSNAAAAKLLEKLGMRFERMVQLTAEGPPVRLFTSP